MPIVASEIMNRLSSDWSKPEMQMLRLTKAEADTRGVIWPTDLLGGLAGQVQGSVEGERVTRGASLDGLGVGRGYHAGGPTLHSDAMCMGVH